MKQQLQKIVKTITYIYKTLFVTRTPLHLQPKWKPHRTLPVPTERVQRMRTRLISHPTLRYSTFKAKSSRTHRYVESFSDVLEQCGFRGKEVGATHHPTVHIAVLLTHQGCHGVQDDQLDVLLDDVFLHAL